MADHEPDEALLSKISFLEVHRRREAGLCTFCDAQETPNHHLKHKGLRIFIKNGDDHGDLWVMDDGDSTVDVDVTAADSMVLDTVQEQPMIPEETTITNSHFEIDCVTQKTSILQYQVPDPTLEHGHISCSRSLNVCEDLPYAIAFVGTAQVPFQSAFECVNGQVSAYHVFDKMLLRKFKLQQRRKLSLSPKSWKFKYKEKKLLPHLPHHEHYNLWGGRIIKKKKKKWPKSWRFKSKNISNLRDLIHGDILSHSRIEDEMVRVVIDVELTALLHESALSFDETKTTSEVLSFLEPSRRDHEESMAIVGDLSSDLDHEQIEVMELIFSWNNQVWETSGVANAHDTWTMIRELDMLNVCSICEYKPLKLLLYNHGLEEQEIHISSGATDRLVWFSTGFIWEPGGFSAKSTLWDWPKKCYHRTGMLELSLSKESGLKKNIGSPPFAFDVKMDQYGKRKLYTLVDPIISYGLSSSRTKDVWSLLGIKQKITSGLVCGDVEFHVKHKWKSRLLHFSELKQKNMASTRKFHWYWLEVQDSEFEQGIRRRKELMTINIRTVNKDKENSACAAKQSSTSMLFLETKLIEDKVQSLENHFAFHEGHTMQGSNYGRWIQMELRKFIVAKGKSEFFDYDTKDSSFKTSRKRKHGKDWWFKYKLTHMERL